VISNFKTWLRGTYRGVSDHQMQVYLDEFFFRFNRRRTPMAAFQTLLGLGSRLAPTTYAEVRDPSLALWTQPDRQKAPISVATGAGTAILNRRASGGTTLRYG
jgi:hypothetical protein